MDGAEQKLDSRWSEDFVPIEAASSRFATVTTGQAEERQGARWVAATDLPLPATHQPISGRCPVFFSQAENSIPSPALAQAGSAHCIMHPRLVCSWTVGCHALRRGPLRYRGMNSRGAFASLLLLPSSSSPWTGPYKKVLASLGVGLHTSVGEKSTAEKQIKGLRFQHRLCISLIAFCILTNTNPARPCLHQT